MNLNLIDRIQAWRFGQTGISGLDEMQNNMKMLLVLVLPFCFAWFGMQKIIYDGLVPEWMGGPLHLLTIFGWLAYCVFYWAWATTDGSKYKVLPQSTCCFPDGGEKKFTFSIQKGGITKRCEWKDGSIGVEIHLLHRYLYQQRDMSFPYTFTKLLVRLPSEQGKTFKFNSTGEFWHKGMVIETSNCEFVSFYFYGWVRENDEWKPVGTIADCPFNYERGLRTNKVDLLDHFALSEADTNLMKYENTLARETELKMYVETLEQAHEVALKHGGAEVKKQVDKVLSEIRDKVHSITDTSIPMWKRIFKFGNAVKFLAIVIVAYLFLHYIVEII